MDTPIDTPAQMGLHGNQQRDSEEPAGSYGESGSTETGQAQVHSQFERTGYLAVSQTISLADTIGYTHGLVDLSNSSRKVVPMASQARVTISANSRIKM